MTRLMVYNLRLAVPKALAAALIVIVGAALALLPLKWAVLLLAHSPYLLARSASCASVQLVLVPQSC